MKREIKFRVWGDVDKKMTPWEELRDIPMGMLNSKDEFIYMQYTGLKDKNGKEIYEGDILEDGKKQVGRVFWHNNAFRVEWEMRDSEGRRDVYEIDNCFGYGHVIGNIYENPELLIKSED